MATEREEHTMQWHRANGTHRVRYPDGKVSQPMTYDVACDYQQLFGGEVIPVNAVTGEAL